MDTLGSSVCCIPRLLNDCHRNKLVNSIYKFYFELLILTCVLNIHVCLCVTDVPGVVDHSAISSQLVSLQSVVLTVPLPMVNNAPIQSFTFQLCPLVCDGVQPAVQMFMGITNFKFTGLQSNTEYLVFVFATNEAGNGGESLVSFNFSSPSSGELSMSVLTVCTFL